MEIRISEAPGFYDKSKDNLSSYAGDVCRNSYKNSAFLVVNEASSHFRAARDYRFKNLPKKTSDSLTSDGIGTKVGLADAIQIYGTLARDLVAMGADDAVRDGFLPIALSNVTDVRSAETLEQEEYYKELLDGLGEVAKEQGLVIISGESAFLGKFVGSPNPNAAFPVNWSATFHSKVCEKLRITGNDIKAGDKIVVLREKGFRSNGGSIIRNGFETKYGPNWYKDAPRKEILEALEPSKVYARAIAEANGWYNWVNNHERLVQMKGIAHLSGGSFDDKLFKPLLRDKGLSAKLNNLYSIPQVIKNNVMWRLEGGESVHPASVFKTFSCGNGMAIILKNQNDAENLIKICESHGIEGQIAGEVVETSKGNNPDLYINSGDLDEIYT